MIRYPHVIYNTSPSPSATPAELLMVSIEDLSPTQSTQGKIANLESMVSGHCITLTDHVISMRTSYFHIDFASQMKLTKFPLIHCFVFSITSSATTRANNWKSQCYIFLCFCHVWLTVAITPRIMLWSYPSDHYSNRPERPEASWEYVLCQDLQIRAVNRCCVCLVFLVGVSG